MKRPVYNFLVILSLFLGWTNAFADGADLKYADLNPGEAPSEVMDLNLSIQDIASAEVGDQICLSLTVDEANQLAGLQLGFKFDSTALQFDTILNINAGIQGRVTDLFGAQKLGVDLPGDRILLSWFSFGGAVDFAANDLLFDLCFTVLKKEATNVEVVDEPECRQNFVCREAFGNGGAPINNISVSGGMINENAGGGSNPPIANFSANRTTITAGQTVTFSDLSSGNPTAWAWTFDGGTPGTSNQQNPTVTYNTPGTYRVSLRATNADGNDTENKNAFITVQQANNNPDEFTLEIGNASGAVGSEVCVSVNAFKFDQILGMLFGVDYDPEILEFSRIDNINDVFSDDLLFGDPNQGGSPGLVTVQRFSFAGTVVSVPDGATLFDICFTVKCDAEATIDFKDPSATTTIEITDGNENSIDFNGNSGTVNQGGPATCEGGNGGNDMTTCDGSFKLDVLNGFGAVNDEVCVSVNACSFENILGMLFALDYDPNVLRFERTDNVNDAFSDDLLFGDPNQGGQPGTITVQRFSFAGTDITVEDGETLFDICFTVLGDTQTSITFKDPSPTTTIEITDINENLVPFSGDPGIINGSQTGLNANFSANRTNIIVGETVSFNDLSSGNPSSWQWSFGGGTPASSSAQNPTITYNTAGVFAVTLTVTGADGTDTETKAAFITVTDQKVFDEFTLDITDGLGEVGETVCVDVQAHKFQNLTGTTFAIDYDPSIIRFVRTENLNSELSDAVFGLPGDGDVQAGTIGFQWFPNNVNPRTLDDGETVFTICFEVLIKEKAVLDFKDPPGSVIEILDENLAPIDFNGDPGEINGIQPPNIAQADVTDVSCRGESTGAISLTVTGGTGSFSFQWSGGVGSSANLSNLSAGVYSVTITDNGSGLVSQESYTINEPTTGIEVVDLNATNISCFGENDGAVAVNANGGTGALTFNWSDGLPNAANQNNLRAGDYRLTISDAAGCQLIEDVEISEPAEIQIEVNKSDISCFDEMDGSIALTISGGTPNFNYTWNNGLTGNTPTQNGLSQGMYNVTVTDGRGCTEEMRNIEITRPPQLQIFSINPRNIDTGNDGRVTLTANGGNPAYSYRWEGPNDFTATTKDLVNLGVGGEYCVTITDQNECSISECVFVAQQLQITDADIRSTCSGESTGSITLSFVGGRPDYQFAWSTGATTAQIDDLPVGNYSVTITDSDSEQVTGNFEVGELATIEVMADITLNTDGLNDGVIDLTVEGGQGPYTYNWENGAATEDIGGLGRGEYCITITDNRGCTFDACYAITAPLAASSSKTDISCNGANDGTATISVQGGNPPFAVELNGEVIMEDVNTRTIVLEDLSAGMLTFNLTDENGTTVTGDLTITEPDPIIATNIDIVHDTEETGCSGAISLELAGGTGEGYQVTWNAPKVGTQITNLCESEVGYIARVRDSDNCVQFLDTIRLNTFSVQGEIKLTSCPEGDDGGVDLLVTGGAEPYAFEWLTEGGEQVSTDQFPQNLENGTYTVKISESSGNTLSRVFTIGTVSDFSVDIDILSDFNGFEVSCFDGTDGRVRATGLNTNNPLMFEWTTNEGTLVGAEATLTGVGAGTYKVKVIDDVLGCEVNQEVVLQAPEPAELMATTRDVSCPGDEDGELRIEVVGGNTGFAYTFSWEHDASLQGPRAGSLTPGMYTVTATDVNNCGASATFEVFDPTPLFVVLEGQPATDQTGQVCNGAIKSFVDGGTPPYRYNWEQSPDQNSGELMNECPGLYILEVTDANGCVATAMGAIENRIFPCLEDRNVISPNGDGSNDSFILFCSEDLVDNRLEIFNRWGELVYEVDNYDCSDTGGFNCWEGESMNGETLPEGAYYYVLEYTDNQTGELVQLKGSISLIRE